MAHPEETSVALIIAGTGLTEQHDVGIVTPELLDELLKLLLDELDDDEQHGQSGNVTTSPGFGISNRLPFRTSQTDHLTHKRLLSQR
jgi:hypothetical protein